MIPIKLDRSVKRGGLRGGFGIEILFPGLALNQNDSGIAAIGRIDHARIPSGHVVPMHPHRNDEILTYIRAGGMLHHDTVGDDQKVSATRLMLMNAGHRFSHEETMLAPSPMECLQIFMRPGSADLPPRVQFSNFASAYSYDAWRMIAGPTGAPLELRAEAWIQDARLSAGTALALPAPPVPKTLRLLYAFAGAVRVGDVTLRNGESLILGPEEATLEAQVETDVVLFVTRTDVPVFKGGMYSGNIVG